MDCLPVNSGRKGKGGTCAGCGNEATTYCPRCAGVRPDINEEVKTFYCGKKCQGEQWPAHKGYCSEMRTLKKLHRSAVLLQDIFYVAMQYTFEHNIERVEKQGDKIHVYPSWFRYDRLFTPFPGYLNLSPEDRAAILSYLNCGESLMTVNQVLLQILGRFCKQVLYGKLATPTSVEKQRIVWHCPSGAEFSDGFQHEICCVILKNDATYVLDISGAQVGFPKPLYRKQQYEKDRRCQWICNIPFQKFKDYYIERSKDRPIVRTVTRAYVRSSEAVEKAVCDWQQENKVSLLKALELKESAWQQISGSLLRFIDGHLKKSWMSRNPVLTAEELEDLKNIHEE